MSVRRVSSELGCDGLGACWGTWGWFCPVSTQEGKNPGPSKKPERGCMQGRSALLRWLVGSAQWPLGSVGQHGYRVDGLQQLSYLYPPTTEVCRSDCVVRKEGVGRHLAPGEVGLPSLLLRLRVASEGMERVFPSLRPLIAIGRRQEERLTERRGQKKRQAQFSSSNKTRETLPPHKKQGRPDDSSRPKTNGLGTRGAAAIGESCKPGTYGEGL